MSSPAIPKAKGPNVKVHRARAINLAEATVSGARAPVQPLVRRRLRFERMQFLFVGKDCRRVTCKAVYLDPPEEAARFEDEHPETGIRAAHKKVTKDVHAR